MTVTTAPESEILELGRRLWRRSRARRRPARIAEDRLMAVMTADRALQAAAFRLVDVAPACSSPRELCEHLAAYLEQLPSPPRVVACGTPVLRTGAGSAAGGRVAAAAVRAMADRFIIGESVADAAPALTSLWRSGIAATVDLLGEATVTASEGERYAGRCRRALTGLHAASRRWQARPLLERDSAGPLPRVNLSVKVTALTPLVRAQAPSRGADDAAVHLLELLRTARELGAHLHIDMESLDSRELILDLVLELLSRDEFADGPSAGVVLQAYLRDSDEVLDRILAWARASNRAVPLTVRLVKGAYWDHEMIDAAQRGWTPPVWTDKLESDRCYERLTRALIDSFPRRSEPLTVGTATRRQGSLRNSTMSR
jgi:RHH-type proline utilization regulon transcriptional repressor/proline dehydrogenase/delta 1-pyrroline-5-carboxylate dehydrogenase